MSDARHPTRVLVVDDDQEVCEVLHLALEDAGYESLQAHDGKAALEVLRRSQHPLVVLLDQLMPGVNGIEVLQTIQQDPVLSKRHAYILMTASSMTPPSAQLLLSSLSVTTMLKPFDLDELFTLVEQVAGKLAGDKNRA